MKTSTKPTSTVTSTTKTTPSTSTKATTTTTKPITTTARRTTTTTKPTTTSVKVITTTKGSTASSKTSTTPKTTRTTTASMCQLFSIDRATSQFASTVTGTSFKVGETVVVNCRTGYQFADNSPSRIYQCTSKGTWVESPEASKCLPMTTTSTSTLATTTTTGAGCTVFSINTTSSQFSGSAKTGNHANVGDTVTVVCKENYQFSDDSAARIYQCQNNGSWAEDPTKDSCKPTHCPVPIVNLQNSQQPSASDDTMQGSQPIGTQIIHTCKPTYLFNESLTPINIYQCQSNGQWTENLYDGETCISSE